MTERTRSGPSRRSNPGRSMELASALSALLLSALLSGCGPGFRNDAVEIDGVVLVSIDTLRADHLGSYDYDSETSPFLDELADSGVLFEQAVSSAPWTLPAHATLLTGLEPSTHRAVDADSAISASAVTAAEIFREAGFATAGFVTAWFVSERYGFGRGFDTFQDLSRSSRRPRQKVRAARVVDQALDWLGSLEGRPFFLFLHLYDVHYDYDPPGEIRELFDTGYTGKRRRYQSYRYYRKHPLRPKRLAQEIALYDGEIRYVDGELRRFWKSLAALGQRDGTLLIVTSDHGEEFFERGSWGHAHTLFDEQVRVPLIVAGPGVARGTRVTRQVRHVDLLPTLIETLGLRGPEGLAGLSFLPLVTGRGEPSSSGRGRSALFETSRFDTHQTGIRRSGHKLIHDQVTGEERLYDLRRDPGETSDVAAERPEVLEGMRRELREALLESVTDRWRFEWHADPDERLLGVVETDGRILAAVDHSALPVEILGGGESLRLDLRAGESLELIVLPIDAEITLRDLHRSGSGSVVLQAGGAEPIEGPGPHTLTAASMVPTGDETGPAAPRLRVVLEQERLAAGQVSLDDEARRRLEALGYLVD